MEDIGVEILWAIGRFFANPLLYIVAIVAIGLGHFRVKRERYYFKIRIVSGWSEFRNLWRGILFSAILFSVISIAVGLTVTPTFLMVIGAISTIGLLLFFLPLLSIAYTATIAVVVIWLMYEQQWSYSIWKLTIEGIDIFNGLVVTVAILVGLLLIVEGMLIQHATEAYASPIVEKTKRGLQGIVYKIKHVWLLPIVFVVPGEAIAQYFPYWPQFSLGDDRFSLVLFPLVIGFAQSARHTLPVNLLPKISKSIIVLGITVLVMGVCSLFLPTIAVLAIVLASIGRFIISIRCMMKERTDTYAVAPRSTGAMIAAVLPHSPAEKMGLKVGETIKKVNGIEVFNSRDLYEALQLNAAHCRLEILDHHNELRLAQQVVYSHDHYKIGLLIAE